MHVEDMDVISVCNEWLRALIDFNWDRNIPSGMVTRSEESRIQSAARMLNLSRRLATECVKKNIDATLFCEFYAMFGGRHMTALQRTALRTNATLLKTVHEIETDPCVYSPARAVDQGNDLLSLAEFADITGIPRNCLNKKNKYTGRPEPAAVQGQAGTHQFSFTKLHHWATKWWKTEMQSISTDLKAERARLAKVST